ncbi:MAG: hypothetical protein RIS94_300 [Pseudomonadota bacterium]|jgi:capsular polysaccharide export protein
MTERTVKAGNRYRTTSWALSRDPALPRILGGTVRYRPAFLEAGHGATLVGWGRRPSGLAAQSIASRNGHPFLLLEDGFLRSFGRYDPSLSIVMDAIGIYYDAAGPSALERLVGEPLSAAEHARTEAILALWRQSGVSKYNSEPDYRGDLPDRYVLVVDQVAGDASIGRGLASPASFEAMLQAALSENPDCAVVVKVHPDTLLGKRAGHFDLATLRAEPRIVIIGERCHAARLIAQSAKVYTVTSQMGFEGLIWGKPVRCFGMPFYAGWGLTGDALPAPARRSAVPLAQLAFAALVRYPVYADPGNTHRRCEIETVIDHLGRRRAALG